MTADRALWAVMPNDKPGDHPFGWELPERQRPENPHPISEDEAKALIALRPKDDRVERVAVRTTTWGAFYAGLPSGQRLGGDRSGIDPHAIVRVVAVGGVLHPRRGWNDPEYNWMIVVLDAATGEHYTRTASNSPDAWPPYFDALPAV